MSSLSRRTVLTGAAVGAAAAGVPAGACYRYRRARAEIPLYSQTVAFGPGTPGSAARELVGTADRARLVPGTRLQRSALGTPVADAATAFLAATVRWRAGVPVDLRPLAEAAVLDLWVLTEGLPASVAAWSPRWRYVWPRDAAFCTVALARLGQADRARAQLRYLQQVQLPDGWFQARYLPGTSRVPDDRPRQLDGTGLVLWAASEVLRSAPAPARRELAGLVGRCHRTLIGLTSAGRSLPPVSPDYWEVEETEPTLGVALCTLAGLRGGARLSGDRQHAAVADAFERTVASTFGRHGFQRYVDDGGADSAQAFGWATGTSTLVPAARLARLPEVLHRPAGGIAPGQAWKGDGISWTPSTSLLALGLAHAGDRSRARGLPTWIDRHRAAAGSIPKKVLFDGRPAAVAPLSWSAANVLLALDLLRG